VISLPGRACHTFSYGLVARRRGYYQVGPLVVQSGDLLGIRQQDFGRVPADYLIVYPRIKSMSELHLPTHSPQPVLQTPIPIFEDSSRMLGVRDYQWGDNPRYIHWAATASTGNVMVKQFQPAIARDSAIFLNLIRSDYERSVREGAIELAIVVVASLANHMIMHEKLPVGLDTMAMDPLTQEEQHFKLPARKEKAQLLQILEVLARVQPIDNGQFIDHLRQQSVHLSWGSTIVVITNQDSETLIHTLLWLKQTGYNPTLILVRPQRKLALTTEAVVPTFNVWDEKDIEAWSPTQ
jgi:uncharacterized protein (DUF58 family)